MEPLNEQDLYSRQIYTYGEKSMSDIMNKKIMMIGCNSIGLEAIKCLALSGVKNLSLCDRMHYCDNNDKKRMYCINDENIINKDDRLNIVCKYIKELNNNCNINSYHIDNINDIFDTININNIDILVICDEENKYNVDDLININNYCRTKNIKFIMGKIKGLSGMIFNDFGNEYYVNDYNGNILEEGFILSYNKQISKKSNNQVDNNTKIKLKLLKPSNLICGNKINIMGYEYEIIGKDKEHLIICENINIKKEYNTNNIFNTNQYNNDVMLNNITYREVKNGKIFTFGTLENTLNNPVFQNGIMRRMDIQHYNNIMHNYFFNNYI